MSNSTKQKIPRSEINRALLSAGIFANCANCEFRDIHAGEKAPYRCTLWDSEPPSRIVAVGCARWEHAIPF